MNPVLLITYNNLELTKKAVESVLNQTIPVHLNPHRQWLNTWNKVIVYRIVEAA